MLQASAAAEPAAPVEEEAEAAQANLDTPAPAELPDEETADATGDEPAEPEASPEFEASPEPAPTKKLSQLTVHELQARYLEVVGRSTSSSNSAYLCWKIRQAEKGKIPVGPRRQRATTAEPQDHKVLPLRMDATLVAQLDEARERLGLKSRMDLFRRALHSYLAGAGEPEVAALFAPEA